MKITEKHKVWFIENGYGTVNFHSSKRAWIMANNRLAESLIDFLRENPDITIQELSDHIEKQLTETFKEPTSINV